MEFFVQLSWKVFGLYRFCSEWQQCRIIVQVNEANGSAAK